MAVLIAAGATYSWWVSSTTPFTLGADVAIAVGFVLMAVVAGPSILRGSLGVNRRRVSSEALPDTPTLMADQAAARTRAWAAAFLFLLAVELFTYFAGSGNRHDFPTVSSLYDTAAQSQAAKAAIVFAWMALGWSLFRRQPGVVGQTDTGQADTGRADTGRTGAGRP
ncbi:MAG: hypothetical protein WBG41_06815 [Acidimicrobiales bacterium]